jgi:DNA polymerase III delta' subunit
MTTWNDILGQSAAVETLRRAWRADRLPHGMIFAGPVGVGKATVARSLSTLFLCERPAADTPCGRCDSCVAMSANAHPDFHVVYKELIRYHDKTGKSKGIDLSIDVIRAEVVEKASRKPALNRGKVFVIEQADLMTSAAQNSLLKTLEEPAGRTLVMLVTDSAGQLLPTIRSRCQTIHFGLLPVDLVRDELHRRGIDPATAETAAVDTGGSLGVALRWIGDGVIERTAELTRQLDDLAAGRSADGLAEWFKSAADSYAEKALERDELGSKDQATREGLGLYLRLASDHVRRRFQTESDADALEAVCGQIDAIVRAEGYLDANVNIGLIFQQLSLALERAV